MTSAPAKNDIGIYFFLALQKIPAVSPAIINESPKTPIIPTMFPMPPKSANIPDNGFHGNPPNSQLRSHNTNVHAAAK
jgi:hypothetical protein